MDIMNNPYCGTSAGNTGIPTCSEDPSFIVGGALVPPSFIIEAADLASPATLKAKFQAATLLPAAAGRIYPLPRFEALTDGSEDPTIETLGFGGKLHVKAGRYIRTWRYVQGAMWMQKKLSQFNRQNYKIVYFTDEKIYMTDGSTTGSRAAIPFSLTEFYSELVKFSDGSKWNEYSFTVSESNPAEWTNFAALNCAVGTGAFNPQTAILGLLDITLTKDAATTSKFTVRALTSADQQNIIALYLAEFGTNVSAWIVKNSAGVLVTIDSAAATTAEDAMELNFASPLASGTYTVQLATPDALEVLGIGGPPVSGYESDILSITV